MNLDVPFAAWLPNEGLDLSCLSRYFCLAAGPDKLHGGATSELAAHRVVQIVQHDSCVALPVASDAEQIVESAYFALLSAEHRDLGVGHETCLLVDASDFDFTRHKEDHRHRDQEDH